MANSIINDIENVFKKGNMLNKLILINIFVFVFLVLLKLFSGSYFNQIFIYFCASSEIWEIITRPWTIISYMFVHIDLWHLLFNMLIYYWFGNIVGDLIGDQKILPLYIIGGIGGFLIYIIFSTIGSQVSTLHGASASVMATVMAATVVAPNYMVRLIFFGKIPIKYITLAYVIIDLAMVSKSVNVGGHISHFGGLIFGGLFVYFLNRGLDFSYYFNSFFSFLKQFILSSNKSKLTIHHQSVKKSENKKNKKMNQAEIDKILEKIKVKGYDSLNKEEKESLFLASKSNKESES